MNKQLEELLPFYALDALSKEEKAQVDAYIASNPEARAYLAELQETADALPYATQPVAPRPEVKERLLAQVRMDKAQRTAPSQPVPPRLTLVQRLHVFWQSLRLSPAMPVLMGLAVVVAAFALSQARELEEGIMQLEEQTTGLQAQITEQQATIADLETALAQQAEEIASQQAVIDSQRQQLADQEGTLALLAAPDAQLVQIVSLEGEATGQLLYQAGGETAVFLITDLPNLTANQTYQAWFITPEGTFLNAGQIPASPTGDYSTQVMLSQPVQTFAAVGVSVEQKTGSDDLAAPTDVLMVGEIRAAGEA